MSHPVIYEINTRVWLKELSVLNHRLINLENVAPQEWLKIRNLGVNWIWLMGVWQKSIISQNLAQKNVYLKKEYDLVLPGWTKDDVVGSPYAVKDYSINYDLGEEDALSFVRDVLHHYGIKLILDFVPNHTAWDHHWVWEHPDYYILQSEHNLESNTKINKHCIAYGRDPNFAGWQDTAQLNYFNPAARDAMIDELLKIAANCDGVRCDMAMLINNDIFAKTWEKDIKMGNWQKPESEFWIDAIAKVKAKYPNFVFVAETYWNQETYLQTQGFDYTYDKTLYDILLKENSNNINKYLNYQTNPSKWLRFIENHDEKRAIIEFGEEKSKAAALITATLPGAWLLHQGQEKGECIKLPVQLIRKPPQVENLNLAKYYRKLGKLLGKVPSEGEWKMLEVSGWHDNSSYLNLLAYQWTKNKEISLIVVNYSNQQSQGRVSLQVNSENEILIFKDILNNREYTYSREKIISEGLYVDLAPWQGHVFTFL